MSATDRPEFSATSETLPSQPRGTGGSANAGSRYEPRGELGSGGMGTVHQMHDRALGRDIALKRLHHDSDTTRERFLREARVTGRLEHPGIVPVYDLGHDDAGQPFYTMRVIRGRTLTSLLDELRAGGTRPSLAERLEIFTRACDAVAYAHAHGVIHRDLKPDNIMTGDFGQVLVVDWGLARVLAEPDTPAGGTPRSGSAPASDSSTLDGVALGTPAYMPPEQARGDMQLTDARSDIYALGATLYELLTLAAPFEGDTVGRVLANVQSGRFPAPRTRAPEARIPAALEAAVLRAMEWDPDDRFASVAELQHAVRVGDAGGRARAEFDLRRLTPDLAGAAVLGLFRTDALVARAMRDVHAAHGLTPPQTNLLRVVYGAAGEGADFEELYRKQILVDYDTRASLTLLCERGLLTAHPEGATTRFHFTPAGGAIAEALIAMDQQLMELVGSADLSDAEWRQLAELLERLRSGPLARYIEPPNRP